MTFRWMLTLALALPLVGCDSPFKDESAADWRRGDPPRWRIADNQPEHAADTLVVVASKTDGALPPDAGVEDYVQRALHRNPSILAAERRVQRLMQDIPQATSLDDPMFTVAPVGEMAQTAAGQVGLMTSVSQKIPFPGKLDAQGRIAAQQVAMARRDLETTRLSVAADVRRAYWNWYLAQREIEVTTESRQLLEQLRQTAQGRYQAGTGSQQQVLRAGVELGELDNRLLMLHQQQASSLVMLNTLMDQPTDTALPVPPAAEWTMVSLQSDALLAEAARSSPQLRKLHDRIEASRQQLRLARLNRWPDLTVSMTYNAVDDAGLSMAHNGRDQWWLGFGINLPIWQDKRDAAERGALTGIMEGVADLTAAQNRLAFEVQDAALKVQTDQQSAAMFRDIIVPQAKQAVLASQSGYQAGTGDFTSLIENWRNALNFELMYHRTVAQLQQDAARLRQVIGRKDDPS